jgi:hypothetical protein
VATPTVRIQIPRETLADPIQAVVDGFTCIHSMLGMEGCERALETVMDVIYACPRLGGTP